MVDKSLETAFEMYRQALQYRATLTPEQAEEFLRLTKRYVTYCVRDILPEVDPDHEDLLNECLLKTWTTATAGRYPADRIERFVSGIKTVCRNRCIDILDTRKSRFTIVSLLRGRIPQVAPMTPEAAAAIREENVQVPEQIARNMLAHRRHAFRELEFEHCRAAAELVLAGGKIGDLEALCKQVGFFRWHGYALFLWTIFRWEFYEYRVGMLRLLDSLRPTG